MDSKEQMTGNSPARKTTTYEKTLASLIILVSLMIGIGGVGLAIKALLNGTWSLASLRTLAIAFGVLFGGSVFGYNSMISPVFWDRSFGRLAKIALIPSLILLLIFLFQ